MQSAKVFLSIVFSIYLVIIFIVFLKSKRFFSSLFLTVLSGICALFAVNIAGNFLSVHIPVNAYTLTLSSAGGIPAVILLLLCDVFMS